MDPDPWKLWAGFLEGDEGSGKAKEVVAKEKVTRGEEQKEYELEEGLSEVQKIKLFFEKRRPLQVRCGLEMLQRLFETDGEVADKEILPCLQELLADSSLADICSLQCLGAEVVIEAAEGKRLRKEGVREHIFPLAMSMLSTNDSKVIQAWTKAVILLLPLLDTSEVEKTVLPFALENGEVSKSADQRLLCASLVGALASNLSVEAINGPSTSATSKSAPSLFKRAMALCQDTDHNVRGCLALQLTKLAEAFNAKPGTETKIRHDGIVDEVMELLQDEEAEVRGRAVEGTIPLLEHLPANQRANVTAALTHEVYGKAQSRHGDLEMLARNLGPLAAQVWKGMAPEDLEVYMDFLREIPRCANAEARAATAFNAPAFVFALGKQHFEPALEQLVAQLAKDGLPAVRAAMARALAGVASQLDPPAAVEHLQRVLTSLLRDDSAEVRSAMLAKLPALLPLLVQPDADGNDEVVQAISKVLTTIQGQHSFWRQELCVVEAIGLAARAFSPSQVQETLVPALLKSMAQASYRVSLAAGHALLALLRLSRNPQLRADTCHKLTRDWGRSPSFGKRMLYCELCLAVLRHFSRNFFKVFFIDTALEVIKDEVPNVRCRACCLLPVIKRSLKLPFDASLLEIVINSMIRLLKDQDPDVVAAARSVSDQVYKMDELKPAAADPEDDAKRADEEQVHGTLERKHHPIHRPSVESNDPAKAGGGSGWATTKSAGTAKYNSHNTIPKLSVPKASSTGDIGKLSPTAGRGDRKSVV